MVNSYAVKILSLTLLVSVNLFPIFGVFFLGWNIVNIFFLYLLEAYVISFLHFFNTNLLDIKDVGAKMLFASIVFFIGFFLLMFVLTTYYELLPFEGADVSQVEFEIRLPLLLFIISNSIIFLINKKPPKTDLSRQFFPFFSLLIRVLIILSAMFITVLISETIKEIQLIEPEFLLINIVVIIILKMIAEVTIYLKTSNYSTN